ncbi:thioredoxin [Agromyces protaetiae]|uniref:Thioredoxin n=1 Tax=Agromyces protaetiae TaxID=2509455 RepID=A0A4P6FDQ0_9MICO|nr:thioredoxin family protein [Agromyces protaetiae]QAY74330.1 thioredoxin [Agromyces protaetiae]
MNWIFAAAAAAALVAVATGAGFWFRARQGHVTVTAPATSRADASGRDALDLGLDPRALGEATLVQFSTEYCSRCPGTARSLGELAGRYDGVRHVEIDLTHDAKLADRFSVLQTPTTLVLDRSGTSIARIGGVPRQAELTALLDRLTGSDHVLI